MSSIQSIADLKEDWIKRDSQTFVHRSENKRSGWEKRFGSGYSKFLLKNTRTTIDFLTLAFQLCQNRIRSLSQSSNLNLSFHPTKSLTDGKTVLVSTQVADDKVMSMAGKLDVLLGLTTHEMGHCIYSDFTQNFESEFHRILENVVEDERIEFLLGEAFPGYGTQIEKAKLYYFDTLYKEKVLNTSAEELFDCLFKFIRYPKHLNDELIQKHAPFLRKAKQILTPYPMTAKESYDASVLLLKLFAKDLDASDFTEKEDVNVWLQKVATKMADQLSPSQCVNAVILSTEFEKDPLAMDVISGNIAYNSQSKTYFIKAESDAVQYNRIKQTIMQEARKLANVLSMDQTSRITVHRGLPHGVLDEAYLVDAILGYQNVHLNRIQEEMPSTNLVFLVDESGSMDGEKILAAQKISVLIREAASLLIRSEVSIYGYTSDQNGQGTNTITIYQEPNFQSKYTLGTMCAKSSNRDGICIHEVTKRVRSFSKKPFLFLIISDGSPAGSDYFGDQAINHTRDMVELAAANKFIPIQIGLDVDPECQALMFKEFVTYRDCKMMVEDLAKKLRPLLRRFR